MKTTLNVEKKLDKKKNEGKTKKKNEARIK